ncbi:MAG: DUF4167 domain-containing protein [Rubellimicrobium sp.]|nr:DUF4167 domain-containing protein [Rubellimicrobium sp.]
MRPSKTRSRGNKNRSIRPTGGNIINRVFDSSGPEGKVRGTPQQIIEKYLQLHRDAQLSGDRVNAENFAQHAEHYTRMLAEAMREVDRAREEQEEQNRQRQADRDRARSQRDPRDDTPDPAPEPAEAAPAADADSTLVELPEGRPDARADDRPREQRRPRAPRPPRPEDSAATADTGDTRPERAPDAEPARPPRAPRTRKPRPAGNPDTATAEGDATPTVIPDIAS